MNKSYKSIWCEKTGTFVAAAETLKARGKKSSSGKSSVTTALLALGLWSGGAMAGALDGATTDGKTKNTAIGQGASATSSADSTSGALAVGAGATAIGDTYGQGTAIGYNTNAGQGSAAIGANATGAFEGVAVGHHANASGNYAIAIGSYATASGLKSTALGNSASATAANAVALGTGSVADRANSVAVGTATAQRQVMNMASGTADTDAVNVSQLKGVTAALGGGAAVKADGSIQAPSYNVAGGTQSNVGTALSALDAATVQFNGAGGAANVKGQKLVNAAAGTLSATSTDAVNGSQLYATNQQVAGNATSITNLTNNINNGSVGLVQQDAATRNITVAKDTAGTTVDLTGTAGTRKLTGVSAGALTAASTDAVNGSQLYATNQQVSTNTTNIAGNTTAISNLTTNINSGTVGMVQQDQASRGITVAKDTNGTTVDFTGTAGTRQLKGVSAGALTAASTDAVNGSQLYATNQQVSTNNTNIAGNTTAISNLTTNINSGTVGLVQQDGTTRNITVAKDTNGTTVDFTGTAGTRQLKGVSAGALTATSTDAVNGSQLYATNQQAATNTTDITNLTNNINNGEAGLVQQDQATRNLTVAKDTDGTSVSFAGTAGNRVLTGVAAGAVNSTSVDAVNGSQLYGASASTAAAIGGGAVVNPDGSIAAPSYVVGGTTVDNVGDAVTNLDGRTTQNTTDITNLSNTINNGGIGLVQQDATTRNITMAKGTDGATVDFTGSAGTRKLTGVSAGALTATSTDAVNGSQLYATNQLVATNTTDITSLTNNINNGEVGLVQQDQATRNLTVAKDTDGTSVSFAGTAGNRVLTGVAAGAVNSTSVDAVNGSQLYGASASTAAAIGGGATVNPDGSIAAPSYVVGGTTVNNVGDAVTNLDGRTTQNTTDITKLTNNINNGEVGLVQQDAVTRNLTVAKDTDGAVVDFTGTAGARQLNGVAAGVVAPGSLFAVNGGQLYGVSASTTAAFGGGAAVNADGSIAAPSYVVGGTTVHNVGDALTNIDGRVTNVEGAVTNITTQINNGEIGLVKQDAATGNITVAADKGGKEVSVAGTEGERKITGVADGTVAAGSKDAVNGGQLSVIGDRVTNIETTIGGSEFTAASAYFRADGQADRADAASVQAGTKGVASGAGASVTAENGVALGAGAKAQATNSVALGANAVADRADTVSVGSAGNERAITNVANGTAPTDAVNVRQLEGVASDARSYTDNRINSIQSDVNKVRRDANAGSASAMAAAGLPQAYMPGKSMMAAAASTYEGETALAIGASTISQSGRWLYKGALNVNTRGNVGAVAGVGYQW